MNYRAIKFPPASSASKEGLLAISRDLNVDMLLSAYLQGIFPCPADDDNILWFTPPHRAILRLEQARISSKLEREFKNKGFSFRINTAFEEVIRNCAAPRKNEPGSWITDKMQKAYLDFHRQGFSFSFETYQNDRLVGGLYGTWINSFFAGESMFYRESGASKFALTNMIRFLRDEARLEWIDVQMLTPLLTRVGATEISRTQFMKLLKPALQTPLTGPAAVYHEKQKEIL